MRVEWTTWKPRNKPAVEQERGETEKFSFFASARGASLCPLCSRGEWVMISVWFYKPLLISALLSRVKGHPLKCREDLLSVPQIAAFRWTGAVAWAGSVIPPRRHQKVLRKQLSQHMWHPPSHCGDFKPLWEVNTETRQLRTSPWKKKKAWQDFYTTWSSTIPVSNQSQSVWTVWSFNNETNKLINAINQLYF